jgi:bifunctional non-homologous end joining protein LigD
MRAKDIRTVLQPGSLNGLLELAARDESDGLADAPWPPHFRKTQDEAPREAPSRARSADKADKPAVNRSASKAPRSKMPLVVIAKSPSEEAAKAGLERWKNKHPDAASLLAADDILVDRMRGRSSTWTRIRVNLRHIPVDLRPQQDPPDPDDDPTGEK